jgi:hypothetical protein
LDGFEALDEAIGDTLELASVDEVEGAGRVGVVVIGELGYRFEKGEDDGPVGAMVEEFDTCEVLGGKGGYPGWSHS